MKEFKYHRKDIRPVLGEVLSGEYAGFKFALFGKKEVEKYFLYREVLKVVKHKDASYKGCRFSYVSFTEATPYADKLDKEMIHKFIVSPKEKENV